MTKIFIALLSSLCLLESAAAQPTSSLSSVERLIHQSGLWTQIAQYEPMMQLGVTQAQTQSKQGDRNEDLWAIRQAISAAYSADLLRDEIKTELAASLSQQDVNQVLKWLSTDLGKRLTALEEEAGKASELLQNRDKAGQLVAALSPRRRQFIDKFVKAIRVGEASASMVINTTLGLNYGMAVVTSPEKKPDIAELKKSLMNQQPQMVSMFNDYSVAMFALAYQSVSDRDLQKYLSFAESPAGRRYHAAAIRAIDIALTKSATEMGREIGKGIKAASSAWETPGHMQRRMSGAASPHSSLE